MVSSQVPENSSDRTQSNLTNDKLPPDITAPAAVERRLQTGLIISISLFILLSIIFASVKFTFGVVLGGFLAYINYRWLHTGLKALLTGVVQGANPPTQIRAFSKFILRWLMIGGVIVFAIGWGGNSFGLAVITGLFSLALAVMIEAGVQAFGAFSNKPD